MNLKLIAQETVEIVERRSYTAPSGSIVDLHEPIERTIGGTALYRPDDHDNLPNPSINEEGEKIRFEVTRETTAEAARRLYLDENETHVVLLNFASARNPGGGFLGGAKAQEEDLARCSALYASLITKPEYYEYNRARSSMLYSDYMIYSPDVPFFRDERGALIEKPFLASVITAPAPNAGEASKNQRGEGGQVASVRDERARKLLKVAAAHGHRTLILGAWGCGVFKNDPTDVAQMFARRLADPSVRGVFDRVVFAIYDRSKDESTYRTFKRQFSI